jgi:hypothetical protein
MRVFGRFHGHRGTVSYDRRTQIGREMTRHLKRRSATVKDHNLLCPDHRGARTTQIDFVLWGDLFADLKVSNRGRSG